jgi:hypothetical protein
MKESKSDNLGPNPHKLTIVVSRQEHAAFKAFCSQRGITVSEEIREFIAWRVTPEQTQLPTREALAGREQLLRFARRLIQQIEVTTESTLGKSLDDLSRETSENPTIHSDDSAALFRKRLTDFDLDAIESDHLSQAYKAINAFHQN